MYTPAYHEETDVAVLHGLMRAHPLGCWVTQGRDELLANHIPFLLDETRGEFGTLVGHVARANPVWSEFSPTIESVIVFQGADAYITPSWYPTKYVHGKAVPTWNYAVVHAHGAPRAIEDREWLLDHLGRLTDTHERAQAAPWRMSDAPVAFIDQMVRAIVGIEIPVSRLSGKWKVSQNRPVPDKLGVVAGLLDRADETSRQMAAMVNRHVAPDREL